VPGLGRAADAHALLDELNKSRGHWRAPVTAADAAAELVRNAIFEGKLRPGDQVPVDEIVQIMGVSRLPVREALNNLKHEGLVHVEPYRGSFVGLFDAEIVREHWQILALLLGYSAANCASKGEPSVAEHLQSLSHEVSRSISPTDVSWRVFEFRRVLNLAGATERLRSVIRPLSNFVPAPIFGRIEGLHEISSRGTQQVAEAIRRADPLKAEHECRAWMDAEGASVVEYLAYAGVFDSPLG
jgi:DNA-binding GntR family transcriptional regulator